MTAYTKWKGQKLAQARAMYEKGASLAAIASKHGGSEKSVGMLANQYGWSRPISPDAKRIADKIKAYWRERGRDIEIAIDGGRIRSRSINGLPE